MNRSIRFPLVLAVLCITSGATASEESPVETLVATEVQGEPVADAALSEVGTQPDDADPWVVAPEDELSEERGGAATIVQQSTTTATVTGNTADGADTGNLQVSGDALSDIGGVFSGNFNTGNNVSIQSNVNVTFEIQ